MNAMAPSGVCPGAMVYHGTKDGIQKASLTASFLANTGHMFCVVLRLSNLRLRVADTHEYAESKDDYPARTHEASDRLAVFLLPWREELASFSCGYKVEKKALVLEEVNGGANKWGCQLGHIKAAQMNGVGQHVFFGPLEFV
ncbi:hypothetical protein H9Q69_009917 [Fusarium xylarioides]|nr:hypothetical protein H9Q69_009917 [Fusarium xylarioides]KAG5813542.1 hypothetical protein H9Q71_003731 [Fusarium xylarioides]KAG5823740.1 hypothetical protein H9Q74_006152 [Fusarium xylarioides]